MARKRIKEVIEAQVEAAVSDAEIAAPEGRDICPTYTLSADSDVGMSQLVQLSHAAHNIDPELFRALRLKVREFELWQEAQQ